MVIFFLKKYTHSIHTLIEYGTFDVEVENLLESRSRKLIQNNHSGFGRVATTTLSQL